MRDFENLDFQNEQKLLYILLENIGLFLVFFFWQALEWNQTKIFRSVIKLILNIFGHCQLFLMFIFQAAG